MNDSKYRYKHTSIFQKHKIQRTQGKEVSPDKEQEFEAIKTNQPTLKELRL